MSTQQRFFSSSATPFPWTAWLCRAAGLLFLIPLAVVVCAPRAGAQTAVKLTVLHSFTQSSTEGIYPFADLIQGSDGNFYGTTVRGGSNDYGTVFRMTPAGVVTTLHSFTGTGTDGANPFANLVQGNNGNFYGTTAGGGSNGYGTVFRITPAGVVTILHSFTMSGPDGNLPETGLIQGNDGNFYGTSSYGATSGTIFRITPAGAFTTVFTFPDGSAGSGFSAELILGSDGDFYGVRSNGDGDNGTVFRLTSAGVLTVLHTFTTGGTGGAFPSTLIQGNDGNFYGTTGEGGSTTVNGTIFRMTPAGVVTILHSFTSTATDGSDPFALIQGSDGNLYGVTGQGGSGDVGTIFRTTPAGVTATLYSFTSGSSTDGYLPHSGLVQGSDGNFYGTAAGGGSGGGGTVFRFAASGAGPAPSRFFTGEAALSNGVYYLAFPDKDYFGYYSFLSDPHYIYHFDLGYEYVFDANDGKLGMYLYDFKSSDFLYTSLYFPFPYLYDFNLKATLYYYPDPSHAGRYNTNGTRYFYNFATGKIISK